MTPRNTSDKISKPGTFIYEDMFINFALKNFMLNLNVFTIDELVHEKLYSPVSADMLLCVDWHHT